jgi:ABC-type nitrate/sulfonate/bicarbonate transport system permease component
MTQIEPPRRAGADAAILAPAAAGVVAGPTPIATEDGVIGARADVGWVWQLASFGLVLGAWEIAGRWPISLAFPPVSRVMTALFEMAAAGDFTHAYAITLPPLVVGVTVVGVLGVSLGIAMGLSRGAEWIGMPLMVVLQTAPIAALIPLLTYFYGVSATSKTAAVILLSAPIVVLNSYRGIRNTNTSLVDMCRCFLGTRLQQITKIMPLACGSMILVTCCSRVPRKQRHMSMSEVLVLRMPR